jgi:DNA-binding NtrC family response regulator
VVDDETQILRAIDKVLGGLYRVTTFASAAAGLGAVKSLTADIIICDHDLRDGLGEHLLQLALQLRPQMRRVLHTASPPQNIGSLIAGGVVEELWEKPMASDEMKERIEALLTRHREGGDPKYGGGG